MNTAIIDCLLQVLSFSRGYFLLHMRYLVMSIIFLSLFRRRVMIFYFRFGQFLLLIFPFIKFTQKLMFFTTSIQTIFIYKNS